MIGEALGLNIENGGVMKGGSMPLGGGQAVQSFVEGVKRTIEEEEKKKKKEKEEKEEEDRCGKE